MTRAVFDPNVLISARISSRGAPRELLHRWIAGDFNLVASPEVLFELQEVLIRPKFRRYLTYADALEYVLWIHDMAEVSDEMTANVVQGATPDPDDDYLLGVVALSRADVLVSGDPHLLNLTAITEYRNFLAMVYTPRQFLDELRYYEAVHPVGIRFSEFTANDVSARVSFAGGVDSVRLMQGCSCTPTLRWGKGNSASEPVA